MAVESSSVRSNAHRCAALLLCLALTACAAPPVQRPDYLLQDQLFRAPERRAGAEDIFALSDAMRSYARNEIASRQRATSRNRGLFEALYRKGALKLEYDAALTRTAGQAFDARAGNCLSLVIMTAAFARELGVEYQFQAAIHETGWSRSGELYVRSGHVNVTIGNPLDPRANITDPPLTIDFLPPGELRGLRTQRIGEHTVIAMFMNNRASESLVDGRIDDAYWWARDAIHSDPAFLKTYNTLGVVYRHHGDIEQAARAFRYVLANAPDNVAALSNLMQLERQRGHLADAAALERELARLEQAPPFHFLNLGRQAMAAGDFGTARALFAREVARDPFNDEFHFWLAVAEFRLGDVERAKRQLAQALENSPSRAARDRYAAKLAWLRAQGRE